MSFAFQDHMIPVNQGHAVGRGWTTATEGRPMGVTWHWTAMTSLQGARRVLGGEGTLTSRVSAHYCIGRSFADGVDRYVGLDNRSWHAGIHQVLRWDGRAATNRTKGARACIGIETSGLGYARAGVPAEPDWIPVHDTNSRWQMRIQPWTEEQFEMMVSVGKEIRAAWPHIPWQHHHGHNDICPGYKQDVAGLPFAELLRAIYDDDTIPDLWTPLRDVKSRQRVLIALGYDLGRWADDGHWGNFSARELEKFQRDTGQEPVPYWTVFTSQKAEAALRAQGKSLADVAATPAT